MRQRVALRNRHAAPPGSERARARAVSVAGLVPVVVLIAAATAGCGGPSDPEAKLRRTLEDAEAAVEAKDLGAVKDVIAETYADDVGHDKRELTRYLAGLLLRNQAVHVATRIRDLRLESAERAQVEMIAALASGPIEVPTDLARLRADVYHLEFRFASIDDRWQMVHARWRPAAASDLFQ